MDFLQNPHLYSDSRWFFPPVSLFSWLCAARSSLMDLSPNLDQQDSSGRGCWPLCTLGLQYQTTIPSQPQGLPRKLWCLLPTFQAELTSLCSWACSPSPCLCQIWSLCWTTSWCLLWSLPWYLTAQACLHMPLYTTLQSSSSRGSCSNYVGWFVSEVFLADSSTHCIAALQTFNSGYLCLSLLCLWYIRFHWDFLFFPDSQAHFRHHFTQHSMSNRKKCHFDNQFGY